MFSCLAVDPGGMTGLAVCRAESKPASLTTEGIYWGTYNVETMNQLVQEIAHEAPLTVLVLEQFTTSQRLNKHSQHAIELCGGVKAICAYLNIPVVIHTPQFRYPYMDEAKRLLHGRRFTDHEGDSAAHLLGFLKEGR